MIDPVSSAGFPCGEIPRYRKKSQKRPPKKADHKHDFSRKVILRGHTRYARFNTAHGFVGGEEYAAGSQCPVCGRVRIGFPNETTVARVSGTLEIPWGDSVRKRTIIRPEYANLPVVDVNNLIDLEVKTNGC